MKHIGDFDLAQTLFSKFSTYQPSTGATFALAGSPAVAVYKDGSTTQSTAGAAITANFDSIDGQHHVAIDTSADGTFYSAGSHFEVVLSAGSVDGVSIAGSALFSFTLRKDSALKPTTAGRALDVTAAGNAGIDWANVENPTTALNLSGTNIDPDQVVASVSGAVASVTGNVGGNVTGSVGSVTGLTAADVGAIKAKTDNLPSDPADQSLIIAATTSISSDVAAVKADTAAILLDTGTDGVVVASGSKTGYRLSSTGVDDILDDVVEGSVTVRESLRLANAALGGKASGLATTEATFRDLGDTKDRIVTTVDGDGNRSAVTLDLS